MGWTDRLAGKLGKPPAWATCLKPQEISTQDFLARCHAQLCINGGARENWPRVGLEAMAAGCAVVASRAAGMDGVISDGINGLLVPPGDSTALASAMIALLSDGNLRQRCGEKARQLMQQRYQWSTVAGEFEELYRQARL